MAVEAATTAPPAPSRESVEVVRTVRRGVRRRTSIALILALVVWFGLFAARVLLGDYTVTIPDFLRIVTGEDIPTASFIVMESKLPRACAGTLAGLAFGVSGAVFQSMLRNPLASPDVIGISMGCSAAAVISLVWLGLAGEGVAVAAVIGGLTAAVAVVFLSGSRGTATTKLLLVGIGLAAALQALVQWVMITADVHRAHDAMVWLTGSLGGASWPEILRMLVAVVVLVPVVLGLLPRLRALELGDDASQGLGVRAQPTRLLVMAAVVLVIAICTSVVGPIAFVALLSGPIARRLAGGRTAVPLAGLVGACIVLAADYIGAYGVGDDNLPVGVVTGVAGAPFLLWLLISTRRTIKDG